MPAEISITIPLQPPSVNHYWGQKRGRAGMFGGKYIKPAGVAWKAAVAALLRGETLLDGIPPNHWDRQRYCIEVWVYLGRKAKGDGDNMWKGILDSLTNAGAIHSDTGTACVDLYLHVREDRASADTRTVINMWRLEEGAEAGKPGKQPKPQH